MTRFHRHHSAWIAAAWLLLSQSRPASAQAPLPPTPEQQVATWVQRYTGTPDARAALEHAIIRAQPYAALIAAKLASAGLPGQLIYLPIVESTYDPWAESRVGPHQRPGAVGIWQFMPGTARTVGLEVSPWLDERRDPLKATDAAIRYLSDLWTAYRNWALVLAAYNAGGGRVDAAVRRVGGQRQWGDNTYWAAQPLLATETQNYVPQWLAVARIGQHPEQYGLQVPRDFAIPDLIRVPLPPGTTLAAVAEAFHVSTRWIAAWNPALQFAATPPDRDYALLLPSANAATNRVKLLAMPARDRTLSAAQIAAVRPGRGTH